MTKKTIKRWFIAAVAYFVILVVIGIVLSVLDQSERRLVYSTFKDLIPLLIAIPAAWLGYCFQRRMAFAQQLRSLWSAIVDATWTALHYTHLEEPTSEDHAFTLMKLSVAIDEIRGLYKNLKGADERRGLYPFEPLKDIHLLITNLSCGKGYDSKKAKETRDKIFALWVDVRHELLKEFDREKPTFPHSHWADLGKSRVYEKHGIPKTPT
jgi:hypothetical protein